ncbi:MAG: AAC(3) family N-acetyltransferase [Pseudomonadota bacterium]
MESLSDDLASLGVCERDGLFVHASMKAVGSVVGGPRTVIEALLNAVGDDGLVGMPGFSSDAYFPTHIDRSALTPEKVIEVENAVPGFDIVKSPTSGMGVISEMFRTWPGTQRSDHPAVSICLKGPEAKRFLQEHSLSWATGEKTPLGRLRNRQSMKILLVGVGWNRCSALHTAETLATHRRTKTRRFKNGSVDGAWIETPDVADDLNRLFPAVGAAFDSTGAVSKGTFGNAHCQICDFRALVEFAADWIDRANEKSGELH